MPFGIQKFRYGTIPFFFVASKTLLPLPDVAMNEALLLLLYFRFLHFPLALKCFFLLQGRYPSLAFTQLNYVFCFMGPDQKQCYDKVNHHLTAVSTCCPVPHSMVQKH